MGRMTRTQWMSDMKSVESTSKKHSQVLGDQWPTTTWPNSTSSAGSSTPCTSKVRVKGWQCNGQMSLPLAAALQRQLMMMTTCTHENADTRSAQVSLSTVSA